MLSPFHAYSIAHKMRFVKRFFEKIFLEENFEDEKRFGGRRLDI